MKWTKIIYLSLFFIPFLIIYADTSIYQDIDSIPLINFLFYGVIILLSLFNPIFFTQIQSTLEANKIILLSLTIIIAVVFSFFYYQYKNQLLKNVIIQTVNEDFQLICFDIVSEPSTPNAYIYPDEKRNMFGTDTFKVKMKENKENQIDDLFNKILRD